MKLEAIIEKGDSGEYSIYIPESIHAVNGYGKTEAEAKECLRGCIDDIVDCCREAGIDDGLNGGDVTILYRYDLSGFFKTYNMFNIAALSKYLGINSDLMRQYKMGKTYISEERKMMIEAGIHKIARDLLSVQF